MKKFLLTILLFLIPTIGNCATTWYACTSGGNWSANVWTSVLADQGTCAAALGTPVAGDTATLNASSGNITITAAAASAFLDETGYAGTLAFGTQTLTLTTGGNIGGAMTSTSGTISDGGGTITLLSTATGTFPTLKITAATTLTASTFTWPGALTFSGAATNTLSNGGATWTNSGLVSMSTGAQVLNKNTTGDTLTANGGLTTNSNATVGGTATIIIGGGTWTGNVGTAVSNNVTLAGNVTMSGVISYGNANTLLYSSGTITTTGSTLNLHFSCTVNTSGVTWSNISEDSGSQTFTLGSALNATGTMYLSDATTTFSGAFPITVGGLVGGAANNLTLVAGQTLTITNSMSFGGNNITAGGVALNTTTIKSATASSPTYLNYTGTVANEQVYGMTFTDVNFSGPPVSGYGPVLINYNGATLTRTVGIKNVPTTSIVRPINYYNGA